MNPYIGGLVLWRPHAVFQSLRVWVWYHIKQVVRDGGMCGVHVMEALGNAVIYLLHVGKRSSVPFLCYHQSPLIHVQVLIAISDL